MGGRSMPNRRESHKRTTTRLSKNRQNKHAHSEHQENNILQENAIQASLTSPTAQKEPTVKNTTAVTAPAMKIHAPLEEPSPAPSQNTRLPRRFTEATPAERQEAARSSAHALAAVTLTALISGEQDAADPFRVPETEVCGTQPGKTGPAGDGAATAPSRKTLLLLADTAGRKERMEGPLSKNSEGGSEETREEHAGAAAAAGTLSGRSCSAPPVQRVGSSPCDSFAAQSLSGLSSQGNGLSERPSERLGRPGKALGAALSAEQGGRPSTAPFSAEEQASPLGILRSLAYREYLKFAAVAVSGAVGEAGPLVQAVSPLGLSGSAGPSGVSSGFSKAEGAVGAWQGYAPVSSEDGLAWAGERHFDPPNSPRRSSFEALRETAATEIAQLIRKRLRGRPAALRAHIPPGEAAKVRCFNDFDEGLFTLNPATERYACPFAGCKKEFPSLSRIKRHYIIHTDIKPFKCLNKECPRTFSRRDNMLQHYRTHCPYTR